MNLQQHLRSERALRLAGLLACGALLFLVGSAICPPAQENEVNATTGQATPATTSVTLSVEDDPLSFDLKPISSDGTFAESTTMTITASTNSFSGYTLSIAAQSGDNTTKLINTDTEKCPVTETKCSIASLSGVVTKNAYADPVDSTAVEAVRNTWGFSPSEYLDGETSIDNSATDGTEKYLPISTTATNLAKTIVANNDVPNTYTMKIGARVDSNIAMGTYENTFVIAAVGNGATYTINYVDSTGEAAGMPANQTNLETYATNVALRSDMPTRANFYFAGWCSANTTTTDCNGSIYKPGDNFGIDQTSNDNTITLYAMWTDCQAGKICYKGNGNTSGSMGIQSVGTSATEAVLLASNFQRTGYGFLGWSTVENPTIGTDTIYGPMETVSGLDLSLSGMKLYAVWKEAATTPAYLQDWTGCSDLTQVTYNNGALTVSADSFIALKDKRDNQTYAIARLADGNCWMIENLRLESTGTVGNNTIDPNVTNRSLAQGYGGVFNGLASAETANFSNSTTANSLYSADGSTTYTIDPETHKSANNNYYTGYYFPRYRNSNTNLADDYSTTSADANTYAYGNYYTWTAAMANTTYYTSYSASDAANTSICPSGWRLPLGVSRNTINLSFSKLDYSMGGSGATANANTDPTGAVRSKAWRSFPNNFLYSGYAGSSYIYGRGSLGYYWSSSAVNANDAYTLYLYSSGLRPGTYNYSRFLGFTVRCVVAPSP